jgi:hypothetical protein
LEYQKDRRDKPKTPKIIQVKKEGGILKEKSKNETQ